MEIIGDKAREVYKLNGFQGPNDCDLYETLIIPEDFQPADKKIKMTVEEKKEFDNLRGFSLGAILTNLDINTYPNLYNRLFSGKVSENNQAQLEFARAWGAPSLIEVEEKKYYVHLFKSQDDGYLNQMKDNLKFVMGSNAETDLYKVQFTEDEIQGLKDLGFKINYNALEEVPE